MEDKIIVIVSQVANIKAGELDVDQTFKAIGLNSSIKLIRLQRSLEKELGVSFPGLSPDTYVRDILGSSSVSSTRKITNPVEQEKLATPKTSVSPSNSSSLLNMGIGVDIEELNNLPESSAYAADDFYTSTFTPSEIAYAVRAKEPRVHFCGMFCAKEALIKSDLLFADLKMIDIEVQHSTRGVPSLKILQALPNHYSIKVSISHTDNFATAMVICHIG